MTKHSLVLDQTSEFVIAVLDKADKKDPIPNLERN